MIKRRREVGDIVIPGTNILTLISMDSLWISDWVDETEIAKLRLEQPSRIVFRSEPELSFLGKVARAGREANRETREMIVDVELLERPEYWAIGQRAEVYIENGRSNDALTVPLKFCELEGNKVTIFIEQSGVAKVQTVDVTLRARDRIAVSNGVDEGDVLLRLPDGAKLRDGQKVRLP